MCRQKILLWCIVLLKWILHIFSDWPSYKYKHKPLEFILQYVSEITFRIDAFDF